MVNGAVLSTRKAVGAVTSATTPSRLRLLLVTLVLLCLAWGGLATFTVSQYSSAASSVVAVREPLSLDAQQIYRHLSDADNTAATAFLAGGLEPPAARPGSVFPPTARRGGFRCPGPKSASGGAASPAASTRRST
jgi:hypothetical protein